jgi:hypothetical protein
MSSEPEHVIDVCQPTDPLVRTLIPINVLARERWLCTPAYARRRLLKSGVRLVAILGRFNQYLHVRRRDVEEVEKALTVYLKRKRPGEMKT